MSEILNCSLTSVRRYCKKYGIEFKRGIRKNTRWSSFSKWLKENPDVKLPNSNSQIAKISGCSEQAVKNYIGRQRWKARDLIKAKPWGGANGVVWTSIRGHKISDASFAKVHGMVSYTGRIKFTVKLQDNSIHVFLMTSNQLEELYGTNI